MPSFLSDNNTPNRNDPEWVILQKILGSLNTISGGGSGGGPFVEVSGDTMTGPLKINGSNYIIIGSASSASAPLHIGDTTGSNSSDAQVLVRRAVNNSVAGNGHCFSDSSTITRSGGIGYNSFDGRVVISGANNFDHYVPFQAAPTYSSSGTISNLYGFYSLPTITAGTVTNNYGLFVAAASVSGGSIVNDYGLYIAGPSAGTSSNYAIYTTGSAWTRLGGPLGIGANPTATDPLYVYSDQNAVVLHTLRNVNAGNSAASWLRVQSPAGMLEFRAYPIVGSLADTGVIRWTDLAGGLAFYNSTGSAEIIRFTDTMVTFGGVSASEPGLKRSSAILQCRLGNDSAYASFEADTIRTATARTVAQLPAAGTPGRRAYVTDANATTFMSIVSGGGSNVVPVFDNGTNWVIA